MSGIFALCLLAAPIAFSARGGIARLGGETDRARQAAMVGASVLWRSGSWLLGGSLDASSRIRSLSIGDVRHLFFAAAGGGSLEVTDRLSLQLFAELGAHRVSGTRFGPRLVPDSRDPNAGIVSLYNGTEAAWAPFAGLRPSLEFVVAPLAVGLAFWGRLDLFQLAPGIYLDPPLSPNFPGAPLGRFSFGADLHVAFRFD